MVLLGRTLTLLLPLPRVLSRLDKALLGKALDFMQKQMISIGDLDASPDEDLDFIAEGRKIMAVNRLVCGWQASFMHTPLCIQFKKLKQVLRVQVRRFAGPRGRSRVARAVCGRARGLGARGENCDGADGPL